MIYHKIEIRISFYLQLKASPFRAGMVLIAFQVFVLEKLYSLWQ